MSAEERMKAYDRMCRTCRSASSWFRRACAIAQQTDLPQAEPGWTLVGYEAGQMLSKVLGEADGLVALLNDNDVEEVEERAKDLVTRLRRRRLAAAMENTSGRTEAEKEAFAAARERLIA